MLFKEVISKSLQESGPTAINMHKIEQHFIMDIDYSVIVDKIVLDLEANGYQIVLNKTDV
jgi:hypothetical protein